MYHEGKLKGSVEKGDKSYFSMSDAALAVHIISLFGLTSSL